MDKRYVDKQIKVAQIFNSADCANRKFNIAELRVLAEFFKIISDKRNTDRVITVDISDISPGDITSEDEIIMMQILSFGIDDSNKNGNFFIGNFFSTGDIFIKNGRKLIEYKLIDTIKNSFDANGRAISKL